MQKICYLCQRPIHNICESQYICSRCLSQFDIVKNVEIHQRCNRCQKILRKSERFICEDCLYWKRKTDFYNVRNQSLFYYNDFAHEMMQRLKFQFDYQLTDILIESCQKFLLKPKYPVQIIPSHEIKIKQRDFIYLDYIINKLGWEKVELMNKIKHTTSQIEHTVHERRNAINGFQIAKNNTPINKVIIFDDVYTTGSTLNHAYQVLSEADITVVETLTLFRSSMK